MSSIIKELNFVDRGDPATNDVTVGDLTTDGNWNDLDLSGIVPAGAKSVALRLVISDNIVGQAVKLRKNGNSNSENIVDHRIQIANQVQRHTVIVACDTNRVIEYFASSTVWSAINIVTAGWWF